MGQELGAQSIEILPPNSLSNLTESDEATKVMKQQFSALLSKTGTLKGFWVSNTKVNLPSKKGSVPYWQEYAYSLEISGGPFDEAYLDDLYNKIKKQWESFPSISDNNLDNYQKTLNKILQSIIPSGELTIQVKSPVLLDMHMIGSNAYVVISLRQRIINNSGTEVLSTAIDGSVIFLTNQHLIRLSLVREFQQESDIKDLASEIVEWLSKVSESNSSN